MLVTPERHPLSQQKLASVAFKLLALLLAVTAILSLLSVMQPISLRLGNTHFRAQFNSLASEKSMANGGVDRLFAAPPVPQGVSFANYSFPGMRHFMWRARVLDWVYQWEWYSIQGGEREPGKPS